MAFLFKKFEKKAVKEAQDDYTKIDFEEHTASESWSKRKGGYEMLARVFKKLEPQSAGWGRFTAVVQSIAEEKNVPAQEKGLEALLIYVEKCDTIDNQLVTTMLNGIIKRGLTNAKVRLNELSNQICMTLIKKQRPETVVAMLVDGLDAKNPKQVFSSLSTLTSALTLYGPSVIDAPSITTKVISLCANKPYFQKEVKNYLREIYATSGLALISQLSSLDASQRRAMEIEFEKVDKFQKKENPTRTAPSSPKSLDSPKLGTTPKIPKTPKTPKTVKTPRSREPSVDATKKPSRRPLTAKSIANPSTTTFNRISSSASGANTTRPKSARVASPRSQVSALRNPHRDLYKALNGGLQNDSPKLLSRVFRKIDSKDWRERKEALEELLVALNSKEPIEPAEFQRIVKNLRDSILDDTNVILISKSVQCVTALATHHSEAFRQHTPLMISLLFEKFKEKKRISIDALREAADAIFYNNIFGNIIRYVLISLNHANLAVKSETELFICRCFSRPTQSVVKPIYWQQLANGLVKNLAFPEQSVRDNALKALGTMGKAVGMGALSPFLRKIAQNQMVSILRFSDEAVVEFKTPSLPSSKSVVSEVSDRSEVNEEESDESYYS